MPGPSYIVNDEADAMLPPRTQPGPTIIADDEVLWPGWWFWWWR